MGSLTDDMLRLCGEIVELRHRRRAFVQDLVRNVAELKACFREARGERSRREKEERVRAVLDLKVSVAGLRQDNLLDLSGARRAWSGLTPRPGRTPKSPKTRGEARQPGAESPREKHPRQAASKAGKSASRRPPAQGGVAAKNQQPGGRPRPKGKG